MNVNNKLLCIILNVLIIIVATLVMIRAINESSVIQGALAILISSIQVELY